MGKWNLSPGMRPGKLAGESAACAKGKHTRCTKENCTCRDCGHPEPVTKPKTPQREYLYPRKTDDPGYVSPVQNKISYHDDLANLPVHRNYKVTLRRLRRGLCAISGCSEPRVSKRLCKRHLELQTQAQSRYYQKQISKNSISSLTEKRVS
jgi:hypothetical protein